MNTRMDKYNKETAIENSRTNRNKEIYNRVDEEDFDNLSLTSNISIIDADTSNLNLEKLKEIIEEQYVNSKPKRKNIEDIDDLEEDLEDTKEYDLKKIIDEAHKNKDNDYDRERFKKLRETQYDILNNLNLNRKEEPIIEDSLTVEEANLMNLIKTVNENALKREEILKKESGLLDDLKGDDNTEVLEPINFEDEDEDSETGDYKPTILEELEKTKQLSKKDIISELEKTNTDKIDIEEVTRSLEIIKEDDINEQMEDTLIESQNSFYTGKFQIKESDMDDFEELQKEMKSGSVVVKILITLLIIIVLLVGIFLLNKYMDLGLF